MFLGVYSAEDIFRLCAALCFFVFFLDGSKENLHRIKKEKERSKKLERKLTELKVQQQFWELNRLNDEKCFAMEREITGLKHQIKHTTNISNLLLQEAVPNFVKKYGKVYAEPIDAEFTVVE